MLAGVRRAKVKRPSVAASQAGVRLQRQVSPSVLPGLEGLDSGASSLVGPSGRLYSNDSWLGSPSWAVRRWAIRIVEASGFESLVLFAIFANCALIAMDSRVDDVVRYVDDAPRAKLIHSEEDAFVVAFTLESLVRLCAYGPGGYFSDGWCRLDFVTVVFGWAVIVIPSMGNLEALRTFRALRPLRALRQLRGMPALITTVLGALPRIINVIAFISLVILVVGSVGVQLFQGRLLHRCADDADGADTGLICDPHAVNGPRSVGGGSFSEGGGSRCHAGTHCVEFSHNPRYGLMSFDSVSGATIPLISAITFDAWADNMCARASHTALIAAPCSHALSLPSLDGRVRS